MRVRHIDPAARVAVCLAALAAALAAGVVPSDDVVAPRAAAEAEPVSPELAEASRAMAAMSPVERVSQLVMTSVPGATLHPRDARALRAARFGGIILFADNYRSAPQLRRLTASMRSATTSGRRGVSPLIAVDQEGGSVSRIPGIGPVNSHPRLGAADRPRLTRREGRSTGASLRRLGIDLDLAPVADVAAGRRSAMRTRSFGASPRLVSRHVEAFGRGLQQGGTGAVVKHFPGFGSAAVNSDDGLAIITRSARDLERERFAFGSTRWRPDGVMLSHGVYSAIDRRRPASTSPAVYRMLRSRTGTNYDGVAMTDSLHASGFRAATGFSAAEGCVPAVAAGADIVLLTGTVADAMTCRRLLASAHATGVLTKARVDQAALRILVLKARRGLLAQTPWNGRHSA